MAPAHPKCPEQRPLHRKLRGEVPAAVVAVAEGRAVQGVEALAAEAADLAGVEAVAED
jgi:hypothetical protein